MKKPKRFSDEVFTAIFDNSPNSVTITRVADRRLVDVNPGFTALTGYTREDVLGKTSLDIGVWANLDERDAYWSLQLQQGVVKDFAFTLRTRPGSLKTCLISGQLTRLDGQDHVIGIVSDVTERKLAQEKLAMVGQLAGGVAHDFNNMLFVINTYAERALATLKPADPLHAHIQEILNAGLRSANLVRRLMTFARKEIIVPQILDLNATLADMLKMLGWLVGENIHLLWQPAANPCLVKMDPAQIDQILANLAVNARDAISGAGQVTIQTGNTEFNEDYCRINPDFVPGRYVMLAVSDSGCGMDEATRKRLFQSFFTTKFPGLGTGLGLATVESIVKQNNGFIKVYSEPGKGTTFKIYLPRHEMAEAAGGQPPQPAKMPTGAETVLLVEDEAAVRELVEDLLKHLGYTVLVAGSPGEAIRLVEEYKGDIHLLMTDVVMPEMNGYALWQRLGAMQPDMKGLFVSGYTADIITNRNVRDEGIHFLQKPFSIEALAAKLRAALSG